MHSHLGLLVLFAFFVSLVFSLLAKDTPGDQLRLGGAMFAGFVVAALVMGWLMYPLPVLAEPASVGDVPVVRWRWIPVVAYLAFIFALSSVATPPALPEGVDKDAHALLYAGFGVVLIRAFAGGLRRRVTPLMVLAAIAVAAAYGVSDEFHQWFVPPREPDILDVVADTVGASLSAGALYAWSRFARGPARG